MRVFYGSLRLSRPVVKRALVRWFLIGGTLVALSLNARAQQLEWKTKVVELKPDLGTVTSSAVLEARYAFANTGSTSVDITSVQSDCGCTVPELVKHLYGPGENGELRAKFLVGDRTGRHEKHILVKTSAEKEPTVLTLVVNLPEMVQVTPSFVAWNQGEDKTPKTITVEAGEGFSVDEITANSSQALFHVAVRAVEPGRRYELTITPERTDVPLFAHLPIRCKLRVTTGGPAGGGGHGDVAALPLDKVFTAFANVKAPGMRGSTGAGVQPGKP